MKIYKLFLLSIALLPLRASTQNGLEIKKDSTKIVVFGFDNNSTYQFIINYKFYEFKVRRGVAGAFYALFPDSFYENGYYIQIRSKKKHTLKWQYCEVSVKYDSTKKYLLLYRDYKYKSPCFEARYIDAPYPEIYKKVYEDPDSHIRFGPNKSYIIKSWNWQ